MKKLIMASIVLVALSTTCFAGTNEVLFKNLKNAVNSIKSAATWTTENNYKRATFNFSGKEVKVYYSTETEDLVGFSIKVGLDELPAGATDDVQKKFSGWAITDKIMFIDENGKSDYYIEVSKGNRNLALIVSGKGKVHIYSQMP